jgi:hypothetical protein
VSLFDDRVAALARVAEELTTHQQAEGNLEVELPALAALQLATLIQVARQHADLPAAHRVLAADVLEVIRRYFVDCPAVLAVLAVDFPTNTRH